MKRRGQTTKLERWLTTVYVVALCVMIFSALMAAMGAILYYTGMPEHVAESRMGTRHVDARPAGQPGFRALMLAGIGGTVIGSLVAGASRIAAAMSGRGRLT